MKETQWTIVLAVLGAFLLLVGLAAIRYKHGAMTDMAVRQIKYKGIPGDPATPRASVQLIDGFGNQLFQVAALLGYCHRHRLRPVLDMERVCVSSYAHTDCVNTDWFADIPFESLPAHLHVVPQTVATVEYEVLPFRRRARTVPILQGWFLSPKYFPPREVVVRHIRPPPDVVDGVRARWAALVDDPRAVCLHIRRGDFALYGNKYLLDSKEAYYARALAAMADLVGGDAIPLAVFSDSHAWCREYFARAPQPRYDIQYVREDRDFKDLALMCQFRHHVLSNSTFGWWGAYLADSRDVIAPYPWLSESNSRDIYLDHWITM